MLEANAQSSLLSMTEPGRREELPAGALAVSRKYGILVVDDQADLRAMLGIALGEEGFAVWLAANGREAFDLYQCHRKMIDVVLLDVNMPDLNGPQTLAALQELDPQICCCFLSADFDSYTEDGLRGLGAAAVLQKPFPLHELALVLWQLVSRAGWTCASL
jgi:DNA-binding response OmpR family regulator